MRETMTADALMSRHTSAWQAATVHAFLVGVRDGSLPEDCFDRWLAYLYAQALVRAQSRIAAAAPFADVGLLAGGVVATVGELGWFEEMAARRCPEAQSAYDGQDSVALTSGSSFVYRGGG
jgi:formylaminopyrimidine deformylase / aminopyrimidine aminohydrolase